MNNDYKDLLYKSGDFRRGGHDAVAVQSTDQLHDSRPDRAQRHGGCDYPPSCPRACRGGMKTTQNTEFHWFCQASGLVSAAALALLLLGTTAGRDGLAWIYFQSTDGMASETHIPAFLLDRIDPTCPQCM